VRRAPLALAALALLAGCGGSDSGKPKAPPGVPQKTFEQQIAQAQSVSRADFPATNGRTLQELADTAAPGNQVGFATSVLVPGTQRLAFGVLDSKNTFVYGKTAVYIARTPTSKAEGPYPAPGDSLITKPAFRSQTAASETSPIAAIYEAQVPFEKSGAYAVLVVTKVGGKLVGAATQVKVQKSNPIPDVGDKPPTVDTETVDSAGGNIKSIDTRVPSAPELHRDNFADVVGKKPVALLFATPQLCTSRVCGPVVDIELQMKSEFGDKLAWIHQEVWKDNKLNGQLREPLTAFHLQTEPWLFVVGKDGRVKARLEGSFGQRAFKDAIEKGLQSS
jgi:hypothetical protein